MKTMPSGLQTMLTDNFYTVRKFADIIGKNYITVLRWIKAGLLRSEMVGGQYFIPISELKRAEELAMPQRRAQAISLALRGNKNAQKKET